MVTNKPAVCVIIPSYNHSKYIEKSILSVLNQTYLNIQLYVIDDGSTDNSIFIIEKLLKDYSFIFIKQENIGLCATLNKSIKLCNNYEYMSFLASDDYWELDKIEKQVKYFDDNFLNFKLKVCCSKAYLIEDNDNILGQIGKINSLDELHFDKLLLYNRIAACTVMLKFDVYKEVGYFDESLKIEDWDMWLRISNKFDIGYIDEPLAYYRVHEYNSTSPSGNLKMIDDKLKIVNKWKSSSSYSKALRNVYLNKVEVYSKAGKKKEAIKIWFEYRKYYKSLMYWKQIIKIILGRIIL